MIADQPGVLVIPNNNFFAGRNGLKPRYIILHGTAGGTSAQSIANYFASTQGTPRATSSHYVIGVDGTIVQCVSEYDGAWTNGALTAGHDDFWNTSINPNHLTITIEHCKPAGDNSNTLTAAQQDASFRLVKAICKRWGIPMRLADATGGITGHFSLDPINRSRCPGPYPWEALWLYLAQQGDNKSMPYVEIGKAMGQYFEDRKGGRWHCTKTNVDLIGDNLEFWRRAGGILGLPLTNEIRDLPGAAIVVCERGIQIYDPERKYDSPPVDGNVYLMHIDAGWGQSRIAKPLVDALNKQIALLTAQLAEATKPSQDLQATIAALQTVQLSLSTASTAVSTTLQSLNK